MQLNHEKLISYHFNDNTVFRIMCIVNNLLIICLRRKVECILKINAQKKITKEAGWNNQNSTLKNQLRKWGGSENN